MLIKRLANVKFLVAVMHLAGAVGDAADVVLRSHALEIDVPAVELALSHDEVGSARGLALLCGGSHCRSSLDGGSCGLSDS